jgi:hypothetical protein
VSFGDTSLSGDLVGQCAHISTLNEDRSGCLDYLVAPIIGNVTLRGIRQNRHHLGSPISPEFTQ